MPVVGILGHDHAFGLGYHGPTAFVLRWSEFGWIEGRNISIEYRWAVGTQRALRRDCSRVARLQVNVIVTSGPAILALKQATSVIPIVFATAERPGRYRHGCELGETRRQHHRYIDSKHGDSGKRVEILREPCYWYFDGRQSWASWRSRRRPTRWGRFASAATKLGLEVVVYEFEIAGRYRYRLERAMEGRRRLLSAQMRIEALIGLASMRLVGGLDSNDDAQRFAKPCRPGGLILMGKDLDEPVPSRLATCR